jgi:hypothetical protein
MNLSQNEFLRNKIEERTKEIFGKHAKLIADAAERGMIIDPTRLSKYFKMKSGGLTDEQVLWIATRVGIQIHMNFGTPIISDNKLKYEILKYDELAALKRLKKIFGR